MTPERWYSICLRLLLDIVLQRHTSPSRVRRSRDRTSFCGTAVEQPLRYSYAGQHEPSQVFQARRFRQRQSLPSSLVFPWSSWDTLETDEILLLATAKNTLQITRILFSPNANLAGNQNTSRLRCSFLSCQSHLQSTDSTPCMSAAHIQDKASHSFSSSQSTVQYSSTHRYTFKTKTMKEMF